MITQKGGYWGKLIISDKNLLFETRLKDKPDDENYLIGCIQEMRVVGVKKNKSIQWSNIREIHDRRFLLQEVAIEIFTRFDKSYFFNLFKASLKE